MWVNSSEKMAKAKLDGRKKQQGDSTALPCTRFRTSQLSLSQATPLEKMGQTKHMRKLPTHLQLFQFPKCYCYQSKRERGHEHFSRHRHFTLRAKRHISIITGRYLGLKNLKEQDAGG